MTDPSADTINYDALKFWLGVIQALLTAWVWLYVWMSNRSRVTTDRIDGLERAIDIRLDDHESRLTKVETSFSNLPTHDDLTRLSTQLSEWRADAQHVAGEFKGVRAQVTLIYQHLIDGKGK